MSRGLLDPSEVPSRENGEHLTWLQEVRLVLLQGIAFVLTGPRERERMVPMNPRDEFKVGAACDLVTVSQ
jgi:hypothetical protein